MIGIFDNKNLLILSYPEKYMKTLAINPKKRYNIFVCRFGRSRCAAYRNSADSTLSQEKIWLKIKVSEGSQTRSAEDLRYVSVYGDCY